METSSRFSPTVYAASGAAAASSVMCACAYLSSSGHVAVRFSRPVIALCLGVPTVSAGAYGLCGKQNMPFTKTMASFLLPASCICTVVYVVSWSQAKNDEIEDSTLRLEERLADEVAVARSRVVDATEKYKKTMETRGMLLKASADKVPTSVTCAMSIMGIAAVSAVVYTGDYMLRSAGVIDEAIFTAGRSISVWFEHYRKAKEAAAADALTKQNWSDHDTDGAEAEGKSRDAILSLQTPFSWFIVRTMCGITLIELVCWSGRVLFEPSEQRMISVMALAVPAGHTRGSYRVKELLRVLGEDASFTERVWAMCYYSPIKYVSGTEYYPALSDEGLVSFCERMRDVAPQKILEDGCSYYPAYWCPVNLSWLETKVSPAVAKRMASASRYTANSQPQQPPPVSASRRGNSGVREQNAYRVYNVGVSTRIPAGCTAGSTPAFYEEASGLEAKLSIRHKFLSVLDKISDEAGKLFVSLVLDGHRRDNPRGLVDLLYQRLQLDGNQGVRKTHALWAALQHCVLQERHDIILSTFSESKTRNSILGQLTEGANLNGESYEVFIKSVEPADVQDGAYAHVQPTAASLRALYEEMNTKEHVSSEECHPFHVIAALRAFSDRMSADRSVHRQATLTTAIKRSLDEQLISNVFVVDFGGAYCTAFRAGGYYITAAHLFAGGGQGAYEATLTNCKGATTVVQFTASAECDGAAAESTEYGIDIDDEAKDEESVGTVIGVSVLKTREGALHVFTSGPRSASTYNKADRLMYSRYSAFSEHEGTSASGAPVLAVSGGGAKTKVVGIHCGYATTGHGEDSSSVNVFTPVGWLFSQCGEAPSPAPKQAQASEEA